MIYELDDDEENWLQGVAEMRMVKESPTSSAVHVDTVMGNEGGSPRKRKRKKPELNDVELVKQAVDKIIDIKVEMRKASFGSRSEAGRYAAEQRWKNNHKKTTAKKPAPKKPEAKSKLESKAKVLSEQDFKMVNRLHLQKLFNFNEAKIREIQNATSIYQGGGYQEINGYLRGKSKSARAKKDALAMQKAFNASAVALPSDSVVYRGVTLDNPLEVGQVFTDKGFMSTSTKQSIGKRFTKMVSSGRASKPKVFMKIIVPKGTKVLSSNPKEHEIILNSKSKFKVVSAKNGTAGVLEYTLELIGK